MRLGKFEWWLMNNPARRLFQKYLEMPILLRMGGRQTHARVLEIGCGSGGALDLIFEKFGIDRVHGFDIDQHMVRRAAAKNRRDAEKIQLWVGHAGRIPADDAAYDAVFDFGVLHHIRDWQAVIGEIHRVLKPGGRFYMEEISRPFIVHPIWRRLMDHPQENRFDHDDLVASLKKAGFTVQSSRRFDGLFIWCVADRNPQPGTPDTHVLQS